MNRIARTGRRLIPAACILGLLAFRAHAQAPGLGASVELVDPKVLRVCADPRSMPFSNEAHQGFEDKLAELFAAKLGKTVDYTYYPRAIGFVRNTLNAFKCDVVMGDAQGDDLVQTTNPYYHAFYALVVRSGAGLDDVKSLEDPRLKGRHIGVIAGTPPATIMARDGLIGDARPFPLMVDTRVDAPSKAMIDEIVAGTLDAGVLWGPIGGYYAKHASKPLTVIPLVHEQGVPMDFRISMGVRRSDQDWKRTLNRLISQNQDEINQILISYGVPIVDEQGKPITR
jgi:quinoprotein dehydrogenase-associated probable ABC transporter substrate-binding protein